MNIQRPKAPKRQIQPKPKDAESQSDAKAKAEKEWTPILDAARITDPAQRAIFFGMGFPPDPWDAANLPPELRKLLGL